MTKPSSTGASREALRDFIDKISVHLECGYLSTKVRDRLIDESGLLEILALPSGGEWLPSGSSGNHIEAVRAAPDGVRALAAFPNSAGDLVVTVDGKPAGLLCLRESALDLWRYGSLVASIPAATVTEQLREALRECAEALECERSRYEMRIGGEVEDVGARSALRAADAALRAYGEQTPLPSQSGEASQLGASEAKHRDAQEPIQDEGQ